MSDRPTTPASDPAPDHPVSPDLFAMPPRGSTVNAGLRMAARMGSTHLDEFTDRLRSAMTIAVLALGGAFFCVVLPRMLFAAGATPGGTFAVGLFAAAAIAGGLVVHARGSEGWGDWFARTAGVATGVALVTTLFAMGIGQPPAWVGAGLLWIVFIGERLYIRVTSSLIEKARPLVAGAVSKAVAASFGDKGTPETHDEIRRLIQGGK